MMSVTFGVQARTWHPVMHRTVRTCKDCANVASSDTTAPSPTSIPLIQPDDNYANKGRQQIAEAWECERYEGTTWSMQHLRPADGGGWKNAIMLRGFTSLDHFEASLPRTAKWISSRWFLESGRWMYAVTFPLSVQDTVEWTYTYSGKHQVRRRKWIRRLWIP